MGYKNKAINRVSSGLDVSLTSSSNKYSCPSKFINAFNLNNVNAENFADEFEMYYFQLYKKENENLDNYGWGNLSLQEIKVINGLEEYKIPAYIGYRRSFKDGINRKGYDKKPVFALLEVASACNIKCPFCFQSDQSFTTKDFMGVIDTNLAMHVIDEIDQNKIRGITIASRGEPLICKDILKILQYISTKKNIIEVKLNTNAKRLTKEILEGIVKTKVNILVISTDHFQKDKYEEYRHGAKFENFINNISNINSVRDKSNRKDTLYTRASGVSVDPSMDRSKYDLFYQEFLDESATVEVQERWNTYLNLKNQENLGPCGLPFERLYIWYDGTTNPCDADYKSYLSPGKIGDQTLKECWERLSNLRKKMLTDMRKKIIPCDRCGSQ